MLAFEPRPTVTRCPVGELRPLVPVPVGFMFEVVPLPRVLAVDNHRPLMKMPVVPVTIEIKQAE